MFGAQQSLTPVPCMSTAHGPHPHPKHPPDAESKPFVDLGCCPRMPHASCAFHCGFGNTFVILRNRPFDLVNPQANQSAHHNHILWAGMG